MPVYKLHRILFFGMFATIALLTVTLVYSTYRMNRLETKLCDLEMQVDDVMEFSKKAAGYESLSLDAVRPYVDYGPTPAPDVNSRAPGSLALPSGR